MPSALLDKNGLPHGWSALDLNAYGYARNLASDRMKQWLVLLAIWLGVAGLFFLMSWNINELHGVDGNSLGELTLSDRMIMGFGSATIISGLFYLLKRTQSTYEMETFQAAWITRGGRLEAVKAGEKKIVFPFVGKWECQAVDIQTKTTTITQRMTIPDGSEFKATVSCTWTPDTSRLWEFVDAGEYQGVETGISHTLKGGVSEYGAKHGVGPQQWREALQNHSMLADELQSRLIRKHYGITVTDFNVVDIETDRFIAQDDLRDLVAKEPSKTRTLQEIQEKIDTIRALKQLEESLDGLNDKDKERVQRLIDTTKGRLVGDD